MSYILIFSYSVTMVRWVVEENSHIYMYKKGHWNPKVLWLTFKSANLCDQS